MSFIAIPVKKGYEVDIAKPLNNCINSAAYNASGQENTEISGAIENLNKLRNSCISRSLDFKHESSLELLEK